MATTADAVIIGGGIMGCSILYNLAALGMTNTLLLEKDVLGSGSTSRSQAILRMHYSNEVTSLLAWKSLEVIKNFEELIGTPSGYTKSGYFLIVADEAGKQAMRDNVAMHQSLGIATSEVTLDEAREIAPMLSFQDNEAFAYEPESGYADPYSMTTGYASRAKDMGARIKDGTTVTAIEMEGGKITAVVTQDERIETGIVVVAAGPWSRPILRTIGVDLPLGTVRHQIINLRRPNDLPEHPAIGDIANDFSSRPDIGFRTLLGVGEEESPGPDSYNQGLDMPDVESGLKRLIKRIPAMSQALFQGGWSGLFTTTPDWHQILDGVEGIDGLYCAVGFSGHGFKESPMIGLTMAELITQGKASTIDISMLNMARFNNGKLLRSRYTMQVLA